ncbi:MAG TPA: TetR/AcrR family transcriptional regulator [Acidimicrobiales bacterium]|nr:TetR/AcrR family transcriptional regulator [Acidimicrobiales bacterium]
MSETAPRRPYDAPRRRAQAEATRQAILTSARGLFTTEGIVATTVTAIARQAGVSPQTVYALFRSKAGVLLALLDELERSVDSLGHASAISAAASSHRQLSLVVAFHCEMFDRGLAVIEMVRRASSHPEVRPMWEEGQRRRRAACEQWVRDWHEAGALRAGLAIETAVDLLWLHCGDDVYAALAVGCRWPRPDIERWLVETLTVQLLA